MTHANGDLISQLRNQLDPAELETELATQCRTVAKFFLVRGAARGMGAGAGSEGAVSVEQARAGAL